MVEESVVYARIERMSHPTHALFHHTFDQLDRERKNSAKISTLEGVADVMFKRGTGFIFYFDILMSDLTSEETIAEIIMALNQA